MVLLFQRAVNRGGVKTRIMYDQNLSLATFYFKITLDNFLYANAIRMDNNLISVYLDQTTLTIGAE